MADTIKTYSENQTKLTYKKIRSNASTITIAGVWAHAKELELPWSDFYNYYTEVPSVADELENPESEGWL